MLLTKETLLNVTNTKGYSCVITAGTASEVSPKTPCLETERLNSYSNASHTFPETFHASVILQWGL